MNILKAGLAAQQLQVNANNVHVLPTDKTIAELNANGLMLVHKPEELKALRADQEARRMQMCVSPEAA